MILSGQDYRAGTVDFDAEQPNGSAVEIWVRTADLKGTASDWTGPYTEPCGSLIRAPLLPAVQMRCTLRASQDGACSPIVKRIRIDRGGVVFIWPGASGYFNGPPTMLRFTREYGYSCRVVVRPARATWRDEWVLVVDGTRLRFWKEGLRVSDVTGFRDTVAEGDGKYSLEGAVEEKTMDGDLLEVVATLSADNSELGWRLARLQVDAMLGLLALAAGSEAIGETLSEEYLHSTPEGEKGEIPHTVRAQWPLELEHDHLKRLEGVLSMGWRAANPSLALGLSSYARGCLAQSKVDQYVAHFLGVEALSTGYFKLHCSGSTREEQLRLKEYFAVASPPLDEGLQARVVERFSDYPLRAKFDAYAAALFGDASEDSRLFGLLKERRDQLLHGDTTALTGSEVRSARLLLERLLAKETQLDDLVEQRWARPEVFEFRLNYGTKPPTTGPQRKDS